MEDLQLHQASRLAQSCLVVCAQFQEAQAAQAVQAVQSIEDQEKAAHVSTDKRETVRMRKGKAEWQH
jgi:hypothetical protein